MVQRSKFQDLKVLGEKISLDFTNTVDWRGSADERKDYLENYLDLVNWAELSGLINSDESEELEEITRLDPSESYASFEKALRFREAAYNIFNNVYQNKEPDPEDKKIFDEEMRSMYRFVELDLVGRRLRLNDPLDFDHILRLIVKDAVELLTSEESGRIKRCYSRECGWLFIDNSKNKSRKWCQMEGCGNRAKARKYYNRQKNT